MVFVLNVPFRMKSLELCAILMRWDGTTVGKVMLIQRERETEDTRMSRALERGDQRIMTDKVWDDSMKAFLNCP